MTRVLDKKDANEHFSQGLACETKKAFQDALQEYETALQANPKHPRAHLHAGLLYARLDDLERSLHEFGAARDLCGSLRGLMESSGLRTYYRKNSVPQALAHFSRPAYLHPTSAHAHFHLAEACWFLGQPQDGLESARQALELDPEMIDAHLAAAKILLDLGQPQVATTHLKTCLEKQPQAARIHHLMALAYDQDNATNQALQHMQLAVGLEPDSAPYYLTMGRIHARAGKHKAAIEAYRESLNRDATNPHIHFALAESCTAMSRPDLTVQMLKEAISLDPTYSAAHYELGLTLLQVGKPQEAVQSFRSMLDLNPDDSAAHYHLGDAYYRQKKLEEAIHHFWQAATLNPQDAYAEYHLGQALSEAGRSEEALPHLERAADLNPNDPAFQASLETARKQSNSAVRLAPGNGVQRPSQPSQDPAPPPEPQPPAPPAVQQAPAPRAPLVAPVPAAAPVTVAATRTAPKPRSLAGFESLDGPILWEIDEDDEDEVPEQVPDPPTLEVAPAPAVAEEPAPPSNFRVRPLAEPPAKPATILQEVEPIHLIEGPAAEPALLEEPPAAAEPTVFVEPFAEPLVLFEGPAEVSMADLTRDFASNVKPPLQPFIPEEEPVTLLPPAEEEAIPPLTWEEPLPVEIPLSAPPKPTVEPVSATAPASLGSISPLADLHAINTAPVKEASLFEKAIGLLTQGKFNEARLELQHALEFDQNDYRSIFFLGYCTRLNGDKFISTQLLNIGLELARAANDENFVRMCRAELDS